MKRKQLNSILLAATFAAMWLAPAETWAQKGNKPGGGGGGSTGPSYTIVKLDDVSGAFHNGNAYDINNFGEIVGYVDDAIGGTGRHAAYWPINEVNGQVQSTLSLLTRGIAASAVNDAGEIVGQGEVSSGALLAMFWDGPNANPVVLEALPGHDRSMAVAINADGVVCGTSSIAGMSGATSRAVAWRVHRIEGSIVVNGPYELPGPADGSRTRCLNDNDSDGVANIVGFFGNLDLGPTVPIVWNVRSEADGSLAVTPAPVLLDTAGDAFGINNNAVVCGERNSEAVVWIGTARTTLDRPTKGKTQAALTWALGINDSGTIVGYGGPGLIGRRAVVWQNVGAKMVYLDSYLGGNSPLSGLTSAEAVNDFGVIVGKAWDAAYIAIPGQ